MNDAPLVLAFAVAAAAATAACDRRPPIEPEVADPRTVVAFDALYAQNCAGCHGARGQGGPAIGLAAEGYLAIAPDAEIRRAIAEGRPSTAMPAFADSAGGMLTDAQVDAIVAGIRAWARPPAPDSVPERYRMPAPPYRATAPGDSGRGAIVFRDHCGSCHGADGKGGNGAGSIVDGAYLALVSDDHLRTTIIAGRPDLGSPNWRSAGLPMTDGEVTDIVAWLAAQRQPFPGQPYPSAKPEGTKP